jgi:protein-tyrosine-phosphatase
MDRVIFACVPNAGRSQMAAALFSDDGASEKKSAIESPDS